MTRAFLIALTFALFIADFGIAASLRSMKAPRTYYRYELYSCLGNVAVLGAWLIFGNVPLWAGIPMGLYAFTQAVGVTHCATKLRKLGG